MGLTITSDLLRRIERLGEEHYPNEVCGLLLGRVDGSEHRSVSEVYPLVNERSDSARNRYAVSGHAMFLAERHARAVGLEIVGYFHSHPDAPARPSQYDLEHATWPGISYPIVSVDDGRSVAVTSWTLRSDRSAFELEELTIADRLVEGD